MRIGPRPDAYFLSSHTVNDLLLCRSGGQPDLGLLRRCEMDEGEMSVFGTPHEGEIALTFAAIGFDLPQENGIAAGKIPPALAIAMPERLLAENAPQGASEKSGEDSGKGMAILKKPSTRRHRVHGGIKRRGLERNFSVNCYYFLRVLRVSVVK